MKSKTYTIVLSALMVALSFVIALTFPRLPIPPPFSVTLGAHVPTMIACFISPITAICTVIGSAAGFFFTTDPIVAVRALSHIVFALFAVYMIKSGRNLFLTFGIAGILHGVCEGIVVSVYTVWLTGQPIVWGYIFGTVIGVTILHHIADTIIALIAVRALSAARLLEVRQFKKRTV